jgi:hypothetical protein
VRRATNAVGRPATPRRTNPSEQKTDQQVAERNSSRLSSRNMKTAASRLIEGMSLSTARSNAGDSRMGEGPE